MKVFYVGYPKTGSKTMNEALSILGYKVSDVSRNMYQLRDDWLRFFEGKGTPKDIRRMFDGFDVAGDVPAPLYWREFLHAFPKVKLILTTRNIDDWIKSTVKQSKVMNESAIAYPLGLLSLRARRYIDFVNLTHEKMCRRSVSKFSIVPKVTLIEKEILRESYLRHIDDVIKNAPSDRLLIYNVSEGWEPLCKFLGKDVPDEPFPHLNKAGSITSHRLKHDDYVLGMYHEMYRNLFIFLVVVSIVVSWLMQR